MHRFITRKWLKVHDQSGKSYNTNKQIRFKTPMLRSNLCDYNDAYIVVEGVVTVSAEVRDRYEMNRDFILKSNAPFISCILKVNGVLIESVEDLDLVMPMYNLLDIAKITQKHLVLCGINIEMNQLLRQMMIMTQTKM